MIVILSHFLGLIAEPLGIVLGQLVAPFMEELRRPVETKYIGRSDKVEAAFNSSIRDSITQQ